MIVPQWVIGCEHVTLLTLFILMRLLGRWLGNTTLIKLMYAKMQFVSQAYQWHTCLTSLWKKTKGLSYIHQGGICYLCRDKREELQPCSCNGALKCGGYCEECQLDMQALEICGCEKTAVYELLRTSMVGEPAHVFTRCHEKDIARIKSHVYGKNRKLTKGVIGYDANGSYLYSSGDVMPCVKDTLVANKKPFDQKRIFQRTF